jgi:predicted DNA-binding protein
MHDITLELPIFTVKRFRKLCKENFFKFFIKKYLTVDSNLCYLIGELREENPMPNMPRCDLRQVIFRLEIETAIKLQRYAQKVGRPMNEIVRELIWNLVKDVELTEQDVLDVAAEIARNVAKRNK